MRYAIELNFNKRSAHRIIQIWKTLHRVKLVTPQTKERPFVPHISLGVCAKMDIARTNRLLESFTRKNSSFAVNLSHWGIFRDVGNTLFLGIRNPNQLNKLHIAFHKSFKQLNIKWWKLYRNEYWIPHCSIMNSPSFDGVIKALKILDKIRLPIIATVDKISLVDFIQGKDLSFFDLRKNR